ncbi:MAG: AbrB/MazE/SpoVT family DNA-binding domain-containing protein [Candidatus Micrarchaeota archaeon]|nr:AbrB/MazE/SpoVT family DNA-binding domain-containing protein [Candidatus Micrarchaeota archaeon]
MQCTCGSVFEKVRLVAPEGFEYEAFKCPKCGEELLNMIQAEFFAKTLEKIYNVSLSKWGESLALRIPASIARSLHLKPKQKARIIPDKNSFRVVPV